MSAAVIAQLLATFGPSAISLIDNLISKWSTNTSVTPEEWSAMSASLKLSAADHMKAQLIAAGIDLASPQAVALLALVK